MHSRPGREIGPPVDRHVAEFAAVVVEDAPMQARFWLTRLLGARLGEAALRGRAEGNHPAQDLDLDARERPAVKLAIRRLEPFGDDSAVRRRERAHRQLDRDLVTLAAIAHEAGALLH